MPRGYSLTREAKDLRKLRTRHRPSYTSRFDRTPSQAVKKGIARTNSAPRPQFQGDTTSPSIDVDVVHHEYGVKVRKGSVEGMLDV